ncbi:MAG: hypothetical protein ACRD2I_26840 [Vicinamibacterales bacterium]
MNKGIHCRSGQRQRHRADVGRETDSPPGDGLLLLHIFARVTFNGPKRQRFIEDR